MRKLHKVLFPHKKEMIKIRRGGGGGESILKLPRKLSV